MDEQTITFTEPELVALSDVLRAVMGAQNVGWRFEDAGERAVWQTRLDIDCNEHARTALAKIGMAKAEAWRAASLRARQN